MVTLRVVSLHVHPVKSLGGVAVQEAAVDASGIGGDRRWGLVAPDGTKVTAREEHRLLGLRAEPLAGGDVRLVDPEGSVLEVRRPVDAEPVPVDYSGQPLARPAGPAADAWLGERVGRPLRLVWQDDATVRPVRTDRGGREGDRNSLSDAAALHLTTDASLRRLGDWLLETAAALGEQPGEPLGHDRFRPNVVVDGDEPFAEDAWHGVTIGDVAFRMTMVTDRCVMTTIDRSDLTTSKEPIRTLARHRRWDGATWFGVRLTPVLPVPARAVLRVGDEVRPHSGS